jgi:hypothetical protein
MCPYEYETEHSPQRDKQPHARHHSGSRACYISFETHSGSGGCSLEHTAAGTGGDGRQSRRVPHAGSNAAHANGGDLHDSCPSTPFAGRLSVSAPRPAVYSRETPSTETTCAYSRRHVEVRVSTGKTDPLLFLGAPPDVSSGDQLGESAARFPPSCVAFPVS